jgi:hypothetical protein
MDTEHIAITEPVRRLEVFNSAGPRRTWCDEDKARIVAEIATSGYYVRQLESHGGTGIFCISVGFAHTVTPTAARA